MRIFAGAKGLPQGKSKIITYLRKIINSIKTQSSSPNWDFSDFIPMDLGWPIVCVFSSGFGYILMNGCPIVWCRNAFK